MKVSKFIKKPNNKDLIPDFVILNTLTIADFILSDRHMRTIAGRKKQTFLSLFATTFEGIVTDILFYPLGKPVLRITIFCDEKVQKTPVSEILVRIMDFLASYTEQNS